MNIWHQPRHKQGVPFDRRSPNAGCLCLPSGNRAPLPRIAGTTRKLNHPHLDANDAVVCNSFYLPPTEDDNGRI